MEMYTDWNKWKKSISRAIDIGKIAGLNDDTVVKVGAKIGDYLEHNFDPDNPQQSLIKDLWEVGDDEEQKALASMIVKMVKEDE